MQVGLLFSALFLHNLLRTISETKENKEELIENYLAVFFHDPESLYELLLELLQGLAGITSELASAMNIIKLSYGCTL